VIDVNVALLLQQQLGVTLGLGPNATIFEICAAIDAQGGLTTPVINAILTGLAATLGPIVSAQLQTIDSQVAAIFTAFGVNPINTAAINAFIASINVGQIVGNITANVNASLTIFQNCLTATITDADGAAGAAPIVGASLPIPSIQQVAPEIQQMNPTVQQDSQILPSGDPMLQLQSTLSPIL
jgi:hypothetical protein